jgi:hypothetical protein
VRECNRLKQMVPQIFHCSWKMQLQIFSSEKSEVIHTNYVFVINTNIILEVKFIIYNEKWANPLYLLPNSKLLIQL